MTSSRQWLEAVKQEGFPEVTRQIREDIIDMVYNAKSGHPGGSLSATDVIACLYFSVMNLDPSKPDWPDRDRFVLSKGHAAPALYSALARRGFFNPEYLPTLRQLHGPLQGHPHYGDTPGVEASTGSLGQGGSVAVGMALAGKLDEKDYTVYTLWGDGEIQEGLVWETAMAAGHYKLDNLVGIVDWNGLQIDGFITDVMNPEPIDEKFAAFGWHVQVVDGHDIAAILEALEIAKNVKGSPALLLCKTIKGKGISYMEGDASWHGRAPEEALWKAAIQELGGVPTPISPEEMRVLTLRAAQELGAEFEISSKAWAASFSGAATTASTKVTAEGIDSLVIYAKDGKPEMGPATREGYGKALSELALTMPELVVMDADLSASTMTVNFKNVAPERFFNAGIAEANLTCMAGGLAATGKTVFVSSFAMFMTGRAYEMIYNTVAASGFNVKVAASHAGLTVGEDGMSHQMIADVGIMRTIPGLMVLVPADASEASAMIRFAAKTPGPIYIRLGRSKVPVIFDPSIDNPGYDPTRIRVLRQGSDVTLAAYGIMTGIALEAADDLAAEGISARVLNVSCIKPLDAATILASAKETGAIVTCEEHSVIGGMGAAVAELLSGTYPVPVLRLGVDDCFGQSGTPAALLDLYGLSREQVRVKAKEAIALKQT